MTDGIVAEQGQWGTLLQTCYGVEERAITDMLKRFTCPRHATGTFPIGTVSPLSRYTPPKI